VGQLGYWSPSRALAVVYAVDGEGSIPGPGLIPLGTVDAGLETIADGGDSFQLRIEQIDWTLKAPRMAQGQDPSGTQKSLGGFAPALVRLAATADANDDADAAYRQKYAASPYLSPMIGSQARAATVQISPRADWPRNDTQPFVCVIVDHNKHDFYPS
jgi:hypothetical protein